MPRNRLTDIYSLGCILSDIVARLYGYKSEAMKIFWSSHGTKIDSYAENRDATAMWFENLTIVDQPPYTRSQALREYPWLYSWLASFIHHVLLEPERLKRPAAAQILARLRDIERVELPLDGPLYIGSCCVDAGGSQGEHQASRDFVHLDQTQHADMSLIDVFRTNPRYRPIFVRTDGSLLGHGDGGPPNPTTTAFVNDQVNKTKLATTIRDMCNRSSIRIWDSEPPDDTKLGFAELAKSVYISCSQSIASTSLDVHLYPWDISACVGTVHVVLLTLQMERHPLFGMPFAMVVFKPSARDIEFETSRRLRREQALRRPQPRVLEDPYVRLQRSQKSEFTETLDQFT